MASNPPPDVPEEQLPAAQLYALAERLVSWEDDAGPEALQHVRQLYARAAAQAQRELHELGVTPRAVCMHAANVQGELRSQLLVQRAETCQLLAQLARAERARVRRPRYVYVLIGLALLVLAAIGAREARDPVVTALDLGNVSGGKPWHCSSSGGPTMPLGGTLDTPLGSYFFYTANEHEPWLEVDLLRQTRIRSVTVKNRDDCCTERAVPLVLEVSSDHAHWQRLAEQPIPFDVWHVHFHSTLARWVRLRVRAESTLHLHSVIVRSL